MTWQNKTKNSPESATLLQKVETNVSQDNIVTPDGQDILVGFGGDLVLVWRFAESLWNFAKTKINSVWTNKTKTPLT